MLVDIWLVEFGWLVSRAASALSKRSAVRRIIASDSVSVATAKIGSAQLSAASLAAASVTLGMHSSTG